MARSKKPLAPVEKEEDLSPSRTLNLIGHKDALSRIARTIRSGRAPQGLLIGGPPGTGKATLAYRIARYLLRYGATEDGPKDLFVPENDSVAAQISAGTHPGLLVLSRPVNPRTGKLMNVLPVDEVRRLAPFFGMTSGAGGWRLAIIDTADDMNDNAANALLKALEEPPPRSMLIVLAHHPGRLLPTIRSRCQRIDLRPLSEAQMLEAMKISAPQLDDKARLAVAKLSGGSIGAALQLSDGNGIALAKEAERLIDLRASPAFPALLTLGEKIARMTDGIDLFGTFLVDAMATRIRFKSETGDAFYSARWVETAEALRQSFLRSSALYLDPRQTIINAANQLRHLP